MPGFEFIVSLMLLSLIKSQDEDNCISLPEKECGKVYYCIWADDSKKCVYDNCSKDARCDDTDNCENITVEEMGNSTCRRTTPRDIKTYCVNKTRDITLCDTILPSYYDEDGEPLSKNDMKTQCECLTENWCSGEPTDISWGTDEEGNPIPYARCTLGEKPTPDWDQDCQDLNESDCAADVSCYNSSSGVCIGDPCYNDNIEFNYQNNIDEVVVCHPDCSRGGITLTKDGKTDEYNFCYLPTRAGTIDQCSWYRDNGYECTQSAGILSARMSVLILSLITLTLAALL